ncbi:MAG: DUF3822 family protein, partial [Bacteroidota bacterium]
ITPCFLPPSREVFPHGHKVRIYLQVNLAYVAELDEKGNLITCQEYANHHQLAHEIFLRIMLESPLVQRYDSEQVEVIYASPAFTLIPDEFRHEAQFQDMARVMIDATAVKEELISSSSKVQNVCSLFPLDGFTRTLLQEYLPNGNLIHISTLTINWAKELAAADPNLLLVLFCGSFSILTMMKDGDLQLCNAYPCNTHNDLLYFIQTVRKATEQEDRRLPILLLGQFKRGEDGLYEHLTKYLPTTSMPRFLKRKLLANEDQEWDYWRYIFLAEA